MTIAALDHLQAYNVAKVIDPNVCTAPGQGDAVDTWGSTIQADLKVLDSMMGLGDGQILIGNSTNNYPDKFALSGDLTMTNAGFTTIAAGAVNNAKIAPLAVDTGKLALASVDNTILALLAVATANIQDLAVTNPKLADAAVSCAKLAGLARRQTKEARAILDLAGVAQNDIIIFVVDKAATLLNIRLVYVEASSADAGVIVTVGKANSTADTPAYYYTGASDVSKTLWSYVDITAPLATDMAEGDVITCSTAGGKVGTGKILVSLAYQTHD